MIEAGDVAVFIDDIMVGMEIEEEHDDIVEEVLRRMGENDFVKLEKYVWKVREIEFLEVVIGPDKVKMGKEKVQGVVDWLVLKSVKDVQKSWQIIIDGLPRISQEWQNLFIRWQRRM